MKKNIQYRLLLVLIVVAFAVALFLLRGVNLGLDLQGGIHLVVQVRTEEAVEAETDLVRERLVTLFGDDAIVYSSVTVEGGDAIAIAGVPQEQRSQVDTILNDNLPNFTNRTSSQGGTLDYSLTMTGSWKRQIRNLAVRQARETISNRVDAFGVAEPSITVYGSGDVKDQIIVELPGVDDFDRVINLIINQAKLELKLVHPDFQQIFPSREVALQTLGGVLPSEFEILLMDDSASGAEVTGSQSFMIVRRAAVITGGHLKNAFRAQDQLTGAFEVSFFLNSEGVRLFSDVTGRNIDKSLAIVLDDQIFSAPRIEGRIATESARITGNFTALEADDLALVLRSGALPAGINVLENRTVGPSLGRDSIESGISASLLGMALVLLMMLVVYKVSGLNAILCLILNLVILAGVLAYFDAALTLPGIAGVILTIGMAVDANILIFERIKEELKLGKTVKSAVESAFNRVFGTILDTNVTTLLAALILYYFGTGPVAGFAVTLAAGLAANIFTAVFVSRTIFMLFLQGREVKQLSI